MGNTSKIQDELVSCTESGFVFWRPLPPRSHRFLHIRTLSTNNFGASQRFLPGVHFTLLCFSAVLCCRRRRTIGSVLLSLTMTSFRSASGRNKTSIWPSRPDCRPSKDRRGGSLDRFGHCVRRWESFPNNKSRSRPAHGRPSGTPLAAGRRDLRSCAVLVEILDNTLIFIMITRRVRHDSTLLIQLY